MFTFEKLLAILPPVRLIKHNSFSYLFWQTSFRSTYICTFSIFILNLEWSSFKRFQKRFMESYDTLFLTFPLDSRIFWSFLLLDKKYHGWSILELNYLVETWNVNSLEMIATLNGNYHLASNSYRLNILVIELQRKLIFHNFGNGGSMSFRRLRSWIFWHLT